jgi:hypothetical protein
MLNIIHSVSIQIFLNVSFLSIVSIGFYFNLCSFSIINFVTLFKGKKRFYL